MSNKSQLIRDAVAQHHRLPLSKLMEVSGLQNRKKTLDLCIYMRGRGEVTIDRSGEEPVIGAGTGKPSKTPRAGGKKKHAKAPRKARPFQSLAEKLLKPSPDDATAQFSLRDLAIDNLIASAQNLAATLRREVEGVDTNPNLIAAIETQERAAQLAKAA